jgi:hypothetical protein
VPIPEDIEATILYESDHTCCICHDRNRRVQIHHIDDDPSNNDPDNLCVLCLLCHNETQISGGFGRKHKPAEIKLYRDCWLKLVASTRLLFLHSNNLHPSIAKKGPWITLIRGKIYFLLKNALS